VKLTHRQETFVLNLLDLYRDMNAPIHYSTLAERVGVSPSTAYDMLRSLEEKGLVTSDYRIEAGKSAAGRSEIVFRPTELADSWFGALHIGTNLKDWENTKSQILAGIHPAEIRERKLVDTLFAHLPKDAPETLRYCFEVITLLVLQLKKNSGGRLLGKHISQIISRKEFLSRPGLLLLGGFGLGLLANDHSIVLEMNQLFLEHIQQYQTLVMNMEPALCILLAHSIREMFAQVFKKMPCA